MSIHQSIRAPPEPTSTSIMSIHQSTAFLLISLLAKVRRGADSHDAAVYALNPAKASVNLFPYPTALKTRCACLRFGFLGFAFSVNLAKAFLSLLPEPTALERKLRVHEAHKGGSMRKHSMFIHVYIYTHMCTYIL